MSKSPEIVPGWLTSLAAAAILFLALLWGSKEPVSPTEDDCAARGKPADCWSRP